MINFKNTEHTLVGGGGAGKAVLFKLALFLVYHPQLTFDFLFQCTAVVQLALIQIGLQLPFLN